VKDGSPIAIFAIRKNKINDCKKCAHASTAINHSPTEKVCKSLKRFTPDAPTSISAMVNSSRYPERLNETRFRSDSPFTKRET
jgi:hypothetical protein